MNRVVRVLLLLAAIGSSACTSLSQLSYHHPPRAQAAELQGEAARLLGRPEAKVLVIAHKAGACDAYPHDLEEGIPAGPQTGAALLAHPDLAAFDGAEIDARSDAAGTAAFVSHNAVTGLSAKAAQFLPGDHLGAAVAAFFKSHPDKRLFVELKVPQRDHEGISPDDRRLATALQKELSAAEAELPAGATSGKLTFISFTPGALEAAHEALEPKGEGAARFTYHLILGSDRFFLTAFSDLPKVKKQAGLLERSFVSGIWFSPRSLSSPSETLSAMRKAHPALELYSDAYLSKAKELKEQFAALEAAGLELRGLVFDSVTQAGSSGGTYCPAD